MFNPGQLITLTTDFGINDPSVGVMKGVILGINPNATIVDISHQIPPQNIMAGSFLFESARPYFPRNAIHITVVDPGVGTNRRSIAVVSPDAFYICPDNGILTHCYSNSGFTLPNDGLQGTKEIKLPSGWRAFHLNNPEFWKNPPSDTFHGRDIFAPIAAYISSGVPIDRMGTEIYSVTSFPLPSVESNGTELTGNILHIDNFGNLITNIPAIALGERHLRLLIRVGDRLIQGLSNSYLDGADLIAVIGSHGYLEIAAKLDNAAKLLGLTLGAKIRVQFS